MPRLKALEEAFVALVVATAFVCLLTWPLAPNLGSAFIGRIGDDASGGISWLWRTDRVGYHVFGATTDPMTAAPFGVVQDNWLNLQSLLPHYPTYLAAKVVGEVAAFNLLVLSGFVLSGTAMYVLVRYLGCSPLVAGWAGLVYVVFPTHLVRVEHGSLTHFEVLVLVVIASVAAAERPTVGRFLFVGGATLASWLTFGYFGAMASISAVAFAATAAALTPHDSRLRLAVGTTAGALAATIAFGIVAIASGGDTGASLERKVSDLSIFGLRPAELVVPPRESVVFGDALRDYHATRLHGSLPTEASNYLGIATLALAAVWLVVWWMHRGSLGRRVRLATAGLIGIACVSLLFALPSPIGVFGHLWSWTPARVLYEALPAFRVPSRWVAMLMTALVPLAALGLQTVVSLIRSRCEGMRFARIAGPAVVVVAIAVSLGELTVSLEDLAGTNTIPVQYSALAPAPAGIIAEYPLTRSSLYQFWQREHGRRLFNGAPDRTYAAEITRTLVDPDAQGTAGRLALLGVTAIVTRSNAMDFVRGEPRDVPNASWGPGYALLGRFPDGSSVWRVTARPAPVLTSLSGASFAVARVNADGSVVYPLAGDAGRLELASQAEQVVRLSFDSVTSGRRRNLRVVGVSGAYTVQLDRKTRVSMLVRVPAGRSQLNLQVEPIAELRTDPVELSAPWTERASGKSALRASPTSPRLGFQPA